MSFFKGGKLGGNFGNLTNLTSKFADTLKNLEQQIDESLGIPTENNPNPEGADPPEGTASGSKAEPEAKTDDEGTPAAGKSEGAAGEAVSANGDVPAGRDGESGAEDADGCADGGDGWDNDGFDDFGDEMDEPCEVAGEAEKAAGASAGAGAVQAPEALSAEDEERKQDEDDEAESEKLEEGLEDEAESGLEEGLERRDHERVAEAERQRVAEEERARAEDAGQREKARMEEAQEEERLAKEIILAERAAEAQPSLEDEEKTKEAELQHLEDEVEVCGVHDPQVEEPTRDVGPTGDAGPTGDDVWKGIVSDLEEKCKKQTELVRAREGQLEAKVAEITSLRQDADRSTSEAEALRADLERVRTEAAAKEKELTTRLANMTSERDSYRKSKDKGDTMTQLLKDKDEQIAAILAEGEKLSKKQFEMEQAAKKTRQEMKEQEQANEDLRKQLRSLEEQNGALADRVTELDMKEKAFSKTMAQVKDAATVSNKQLMDKAKEVEDAVSKAQDLQMTLDRAWDELAEEKKASARAAELYNAEKSRVKELEARIDQLTTSHEESSSSYESLMLTIESLQDQVRGLTESSSIMEDRHRAALEEKETQLRMVENHNMELEAAIPEATRPLVRQIDALNKSSAAKQASWDAAQQSLSQQLQESQTAEAAAAAREKLAMERKEAIEKEVRVLRQELQVTEADRQEVIRKGDELRNELQQAKARATAAQAQLEDEKASNAIAIKAFKENESRMRREVLVLEETIHELRTAASLDESEARQKELEEKLEKERRKVQKLEAQLSSEEAKRKQSREMRGNVTQESLLEQSLSQATPSDVLRGMGHVENDERSASLWRQRSGEASALRAQMEALETQKLALTEKIVHLTSSNQAMERQVSALGELKKSHAALEQRFLATLEMLGEREEMIDELKEKLQQATQTPA